MENTIVGIKALIVVKLQALKVGTADALKVVYGNQTADFSGYPAAVVSVSGSGKGTLVDTHRIERTFPFAVELYQEQSATGKNGAAAVSAMEQVADVVLKAFDQDPMLAGAVQRVNVISYDFAFKVQSGTFRFASFAVEAVVIVPNY